MTFDLSEEQTMLADHLGRLLSEKQSTQRLRSLIDAGAEWDELLWRELAELGFLGIAIPEAYGGMGLGAVELGVMAEALGRANAAVPVFSSVVLAAEAIRLAGSEAQKARWLPELAAGRVVGTFAYAGRGGVAVGPEGAVFSGGRLSGVKSPVADAGMAGLAVVLTEAEGAPALALVELEGPGVGRTRLESFDQLRAHYRLEFDGAPAELMTEAPAADAVSALMDRAAVQAAFEAVGGAHACLFMARDYALQRQIFGRPLGGFQAIKHKLADILVLVELARSSAYHAATALDGGSGQAAAAAAAQLTATRAFEQAARENIQVHGGFGYTFEADCHFYYRRERLLAASLGGRRVWADRLIATLTDDPQPTEGV